MTSPTRRLPLPRGRRWVAERDGVAHLASNHPLALHRAACGVPAVDPRYGWPTRSYCPDCLTAAEALMRNA